MSRLAAQICGPTLRRERSGSCAIALAAVPAERVVPGHGPVADKAGLLDYYTMLEVARDRMETLIQEGKTEDDVVAERPFADLDAKWADTEQAGKTFVRALYRSMADKPVPARKPLLRQVLRRN